jgi:hypothetical protein
VKKNYVFLIISVFALLNIYSCKKDAIDASIVGKWRNFKTEFKVYNTSNTLVKDTTMINDATDGSGNYRIFNNDGSFEYVSVISSAGFLQNDTTYRGKYSLGGTYLTLNYNHPPAGSGSGVDVITLQKTSMELKDIYTTTGESFLGLPSSNTYTYNAYVYFTRQ